MTVSSSPFVLVSVALALLATFGADGKEKAVDTSIDEPAFHLTLPGHWSRKPSSDATRWVFGSDSREQLTVSLLGLNSGTNSDERFRLFKRLAEARKHLERAAPGLSGVTTTETTVGESGGILAARYGGTEPAVQRRFICLMLGSTTAFTVFYYEALNLTQAEVDARAKTIMNSVVVPK